MDHGYPVPVVSVIKITVIKILPHTLKFYLGGVEGQIFEYRNNSQNFLLKFRM